MEKNIGKIDRIIRFVLFVVFFGLAYKFMKPTWLAVVFVVLGLAMLITSLTGYCHFYTMCKCNTGCCMPAKEAKSFASAKKAAKKSSKKKK